VLKLLFWNTRMHAHKHCPQMHTYTFTSSLYQKSVCEAPGGGEMRRRSDVGTPTSPNMRPSDSVTTKPASVNVRMRPSLFPTKTLDKKLHPVVLDAIFWAAPGNVLRALLSRSPYTSCSDGVLTLRTFLWHLGANLGPPAAISTIMQSSSSCHVCMHVFTLVYVYACMQLCMYVCMYVFVCTYMCMYALMVVYACMRVCMQAWKKR